MNKDKRTLSAKQVKILEGIKITLLSVYFTQYGNEGNVQVILSNIQRELDSLIAFAKNHEPK